jgi:hypothetical protein
MADQSSAHLTLIHWIFLGKVGPTHHGCVNFPEYTPFSKLLPLTRNDLPENLQWIWQEPYQAYFYIHEQGGHFVFHNGRLLFRLSLSTEFLAGLYVG